MSNPQDDDDDGDYDAGVDYMEAKLDDLRDAYEDVKDQLQTVREMVIDILTDLVRNGLVDEIRGEIESKCDPTVLRQLADYVGVEL